MPWTEDFQAWQAQAHDVTDRGRRTSKMIVDRARETARQAGTDPGCVFLHAHNASVSAHYGRPWRDVDYSLVRRILWLEQRSFEPTRLASKINQRSFNALQAKYRAVSA